jgi:hypothetical protein
LVVEVVEALGGRVEEAVWIVHEAMGRGEVHLGTEGAGVSIWSRDAGSQRWTEGCCAGGECLGGCEWESEVCS